VANAMNPNSPLVRGGGPGRVSLESSDSGIS